MPWEAPAPASVASGLAWLTHASALLGLKGQLELSDTGKQMLFKVKGQADKFSTKTSSQINCSRLQAFATGIVQLSSGPETCRRHRNLLGQVKEMV